MTTLKSITSAPDFELRRRLPPEMRRASIMDAAVAFFAEAGLDGSTRELSERAGVTQPLLYKYFDSKAALIEAVFNHVYIDRLSPEWPHLIRDRSRPLRERVMTFYFAYSRAIFTYEWMRIFVFAGLAGGELNARYLAHLRESMLEPLLEELRAEAKGERAPDIEDLWNLHGGLVYLGIRKYVYQVPTPEDLTPVIERSIDRFLKDFGI
jgi:AcrR family transcriptional regulator